MPCYSQPVPSLHSLSEVLQSTSISWKRVLPLSSAYIFAAANQETPTDHLALKACGACVPGSIGTITIKETVLDRLPPKGIFQITGWNTPVFLWKRPIYLSWSFSLRDKIQVRHTPWGLLLGNKGWCMPSFCFSSVTLQLTSFSQKRA